MNSGATVYMYIHIWPVFDLFQPMSELLFISVFSGLAWGDTKCAYTFANIAGLIIIKVCCVYAYSLICILLIVVCMCFTGTSRFTASTDD